MLSDLVWKTFGHGQIKDILGKQLNSDRLSHAYLFSGSSGIGKKTLALEFAEKILEVQRLNNHPDFKILSDADLNMEGIVSFVETVAYKPFLAKKKVVIIDGVQNFNQASSNALLKTLEEPSGNSILVLIADRKFFLPTIISRCTVLNFNAFSSGQLEEFAKIEKLQPSKEQINLSFGSIARLKKMISDKDFFEGQNKIIEQWQALKKGRSSARLLKISEYAEEAENLDELFKTWLFWQTAQLKTDSGSWKIVQVLLDSLQALRMNQNKKLILQNLFLNI